MKNLLVTPKNVEMISNGKRYSILSTDPNYKKIVLLVKNTKIETEADQNDLMDRVFAIVSNVKNAVKETRKSMKASDISKLPNFIQEAINRYIEKKLPHDPIVLLWNNIQKNPSDLSKEHIFKYLEAHHFMFTEDGCFVAYKKVRTDYKDCHSGTFDNRPGKVVKMNREDCCSNEDIDCGSGLHVANLSYARNFSGNRLLEIKVNPKDVVSVPRSDVEKMRCCEYKVLRDVTDMTDQQILAKIETEIYLEKEKKQGKVVKVVKKNKETEKKEIVAFNLTRISKGRLFIKSSILKMVSSDYDKVGINTLVKKLEITLYKTNGNKVKYKGKMIKIEDLPVSYFISADENGSIRIAKSLLDKISKKDSFKLRIEGQKMILE